MERVYGPLTGVPLWQTSPLLLPWTRDPWDRLRPPLSVEALRMSAELSAATYAMEVEPWLEAGWRDVTIQVDGELTPLDPEAGRIAETWRKYRVRSRIRSQNPVSQVLGALRARESGSGKAIVMIRPAQDGRYVVAVSFMGTGSRFYDWFSNFRMTTEDGVHQGFHQLTSQFERSETRISFPETARELGLESLTLDSILRDMKSPNSRFLLWLSGHSRGGAVMQVYAHRKIMEEGVLPQNVVGYGFASPSVMTGEAVARPEAYPLYHVQNSDDLVPHCGAAVHLGVCLTCEADGALRRACYGWPRDEASVKARLAVRPVIRQMRDTPSCIIQALAYLTVLGEHSVQEIAESLGLGEGLPLGRLMEGTDVRELLRGVVSRTEGAYQCVTGRPVPQEALNGAAARIRETAGNIGLRRFTGAMFQLMRFPHRISRRKGAFQAAYIYIAKYGVDRLIPSIWRSGTPPVRCVGREAAEAGKSSAALPPACRALRKSPCQTLTVYRKRSVWNK